MFSYLEIFSREKLHSHNCENEPENDAHHEHIEDTGNGLDQGVHHNLATRKTVVNVVSNSEENRRIKL